MLHFLINPASSSGKGMQIWNAVETRLQNESVSYQSHRFHKPGDAAVLAAAISREDPSAVLVAVGGDGTINEIINGIRDFSGLTFACIPTGSGNDFCRGLGQKGNTDEILSRILHPSRISRINIGFVSDGEKKRRFAVSAGMGFDAEVCYRVSDSGWKSFLNRFHIGSFSYTIIAIRELFTMKTPRLTIKTDSQPKIDCPKSYFAAFMNLPYEGGGFRFAPDADPSDGRLDMCAVNGLPRLKALLCLPLAKSGRHTGIKGIRLVPGTSFCLESEVPLCVHTDGEHFGFCRTLTVGTEPELLSVITG